MVDRLVCHFNSRRTGLSSCYLWTSHELRRSRHSGMGVVRWQYHGILYSQFRCVVSNPHRGHRDDTLTCLPSCGARVCLSDCWRHVLCHQACCSPRQGCGLGVDYWLVQLSRSSSRCRQSCLYNLTDDMGHRCHAHPGERRLSIQAVRSRRCIRPSATDEQQRTIPDCAVGYLRSLHVWRHLLVSYQLASSHYIVVRAYQQ